MVSTTSARPSAGRPAVPAKMTSSILPPRRVLAPCSPITHASASTTLDLPEPLGPTTAVMPGSKRSVVDDAKDLNPRRVRLFRCMRVRWCPDLCRPGEGRLGDYLPKPRGGGNPGFRRGKQKRDVLVDVPECGSGQVSAGSLIE